MNIEEPDLKLFEKNYLSGKTQILFHSFSADIHTPVSTLIQLQKEKYVFLFESVEKGSQKGRYSVIGIRPDLIWECKNNKCLITNLVKSKKQTIDKKNPLQSLSCFIKNNKIKLPEQLPSISSGIFGYMGYEMIKFFENVELNKKNSLNLPDSIFLRPSITLVFDNVNDKIMISQVVTQDKKNNALNKFKKIKKTIYDIKKTICQPIKKKYLLEKKINKSLNIFENVKSSTTYEQKNIFMKEKYFKLFYLEFLKKKLMFHQYQSTDH